MFKKKALRINTFLGYGNSTLFKATGRALKDEAIKFKTNQNFLKTIFNAYLQFESDEIKNTDIKLTLSNGEIIETMTDAEGYYNIELKHPSLSECIVNNCIEYTVSYKKKETSRKISNQNIFKSKMLIPSKKAQYGIISDIDDTIIHTGVASLFKWRVIVNTIFKNYDKRKVTEGTIKLYKKLQNGREDSPVNPFFYVSNSPWNLYDYLNIFMKENHFPIGPILLRDFRTPFDKTPKPKLPHKISEILTILKTYPHLKFILIGDSGEKDADIYTKIAYENPNRILAIYLRNVNHKRKEKRINKIINSFTNCPILLIQNADEAITHAKQQGYIS